MTIAEATSAIRVADVRRGMFDAALPFWSSEGFDAANGSFVEYLDLKGRNAQAPYNHMQAQARQIYVASHAELLSWCDCGVLADRVWRFLCTYGRRDDGGWVRRLSPGGAVVDANCEAYSMAFVLFALAWRYRVTADPQILASALATVEALDRLLRDPGGQGWLADEDDAGPRQQNLHMHLLDAAAELAPATGHQRFHELAREIAEWFEARFFDQRPGALREYDTADWSSLPSEQGRLVEAGHQFELARLLYRAHPVTGLDLPGQAQALCAFAERFDRDPAAGLIVDPIGDDGSHLVPDSRLWPQTEGLNADLGLMEHERQDTEHRLARTAGNLLDRYLAVQPFGTWIDHFSRSGEPRVDRVPATSPYHLFIAFGELLRLTAPSPFMVDTWPGAQR